MQERFFDRVKIDIRPGAIPREHTRSHTSYDLDLVEQITEEERQILALENELLVPDYLLEKLKRIAEKLKQRSLQSTRD